MIDKLLDVGVVLGNDPVVNSVFFLRGNVEDFNQLIGVSQSNLIDFFDDNDWFRITFRDVLKASSSGLFINRFSGSSWCSHAELDEKILRQELVGKLVNIHHLGLGNPM